MKLSVITVTWNNAASIGKQIESVQKSAAGLELEQIIVDNGSTDNTIEIIKKYPQVKLILNKENLGFSVANNQGYKIATGDYILFLNPDNEIKENSLLKLCKKMEEHPEIGLLSCKLITQEGLFNENAKPRRYPGLIDQVALLLKIPHLFPKVLDRYLMRDFNPDIEQEVETARGAFMLLRKATLDKLGWGFDPRYFIWFEDVDLCKEVQKMGLKVIYTPEVSCIDLVGQSFKQQDNLWKQKIFTASMLKYFQKWEPWYKWIWIAIFRPVAIFLVWFKVVLKKKKRKRLSHIYNMNKLAVHLVVWNGTKYLPYLFESLRKQNYKDWSLFILDNNSSDNSVEIIEREIVNFPVPVKFFKEKENFGFAKGHNILFKQSESKYFLLLNQDMYLTEDCLEKMIGFLDAHSDVAGVSPRLMRWDFAKIGEGLQNTFSSQIDALGLKVFRSRRVIEQFTGQDWNIVGKSFKDSVLEVFGVSGAFPMYRREAIEKVLFSNGQMLDESYHSYKEDVDLAWRLRSAGYTAFVLLDTIAYHDRAGAGPKEIGDWAAMQNKKKHSSWVKYYSYRNHLMTLYKNEYGENFWLDFIFIAWYELKKLVYFAFFAPFVLKGLKDIWQLRKELKVKREEIKKIKKIPPQELRKWWK